MHYMLMHKREFISDSHDFCLTRTETHRYFQKRHARWVIFICKLLTLCHAERRGIEEHQT